ncbi:hypothetical protein [Massilia sp.]|uniref:hypothetical protein n=1 Tax=Massilia sp. TaxID=1882437 RepID=UPI00391A5C3E
MQHTLVAVFDNRTDAQNAMNELVSSGFSRDEVKLSNAEPTGMTDSVTGSSASSTDTLADGTGIGIGASIKHFFTDLFGADNSEHASRYEGAVTRGHHVLTVRAQSLPEVERAADIVERYGPTDIDEQASGERPMGAGGGLSESMRMSGAGGMQQSAQMSAQSGVSRGSASGAGLGGAAAGAGAALGASQQLDNPGDRKIFQQQSLNQAEPMGTTYQEPMGQSGLSATGGTSLQGSTLQENSVQASSLEGTQNDMSIRSSGGQGGTLQGSSLEGSAMQGSGASMQRDTAMGSTPGSSRFTEMQRGRSRIYSPSGTSTAGTGSGLDIGSNFFGDDDDYYRNHFLANYSGEDYERIKPAYAYGSEMARQDKYRGRSWDEVENDLHSDWDTRGGSGAGSTWESMKAAVRRGWDRMTLDKDDDSYYRSHYDSNLSSSGMDYDSVKPAYAYGSEMRKSELYRNRPWDDIEGDIARGWDSRISPATHGDTSTGAWDRMKAAVRHGWDRITNDDDDDREYRSHWNATYSTSSDAGSYDDYKPAYAYGSSMARDPKYRGRQWGEVENDLRTDWDTRYGNGGQSTWEKMKSAVRHGWDRMTS